MPKARTPVSMLDHALEYARAGLPVIPLHGVLPDGSCTCGVARCPSPGKHPRTKNGLQDATTDEKTIEKWWSDKRWPNASIGGVGGSFLCLDIDAKNDGFDSLQRLIASNTKLPDTAIAETGEYGDERGKHYWFKVPEDEAPATRTNVRQGIDIRCTGGYAVMPPSPHASGVLYEWISKRTIKTAAKCPEWVLDLVPEFIAGESTWAPDPAFKMSKQVREFLSGDYAPELGEQREFLLQAARSVLTTGRSVELTASLLWEGTDGNGGINNAEWRDGEPWTPEDIYALVSDIYAKPPTTPLEKDFADPGYTMDDAGNAERLLASFQPEHVHYSPELGKWFLWDDTAARFVGDDDTWMKKRWIEITDQLITQAMHSRSEGEAKALYRHAKDSRSHFRIKAAVDLAKLHPIVDEHQLDADPFLLGVANGVVDLRTGELREREPGDLITRHSSVEYDPDAESDLFDSFLERALPDDDLRDFLRHACGYSLTGSISEHAFFYLHGRPATGKTTFLEAFKRVMGSYAVTADSSTFIREGSRSSNTPSEDLARLAGARLVVTHEIEEGQHFAVSLVNKFVGGDSVAARFLYGKTFTYSPRFKLWIGANHLPKVSGGRRSGLWRRVKIISMDQPLEREERDPTLPRKLREPEAQEAILAWAVRGAVEWHERHKAGKALEEPEAVQQEAEQYEKESDHVYVFADDALEVTQDQKDRVPVSEVFEHYLRWCDREGRNRRVTQRYLALRLADLNLEAKPAWHDEKNQRCWHGVQLKSISDNGAGSIRVKGATKRKKGRAGSKRGSRRT